jgi:hypothetical protein
LWDDGLSTQQEGKSDVRGWGATQEVIFLIHEFSGNFLSWPHKKQIQQLNQENSGKISRLAKVIFSLVMGKLFPARESLISDILAGDGKIVKHFFTVNAHIEKIRKNPCFGKTSAKVKLLLV